MSHEDAPSSEVVRTYLKNIETRLKCKGQSPNRRQSPPLFFIRCRQGRALPHIGRRSRSARRSTRRALPHIGRRSRRARRSTAAEPCLTSGGEAAAHGAQPPPSPASHRAAKPQRTALNRRRALPHIGRRSRSARRSTAAEPCLTSGGEDRKSVA